MRIEGLGVDRRTRREFEIEVLVHLDAAYGFARRLARNADDAGDIVQEACLRAWRFYEEFQGGNVKVWLLTIVRNTAYSWLAANRRYEPVDPQAELLSPVEPASLPDDPEAMLRRVEERAVLDRLVQSLPRDFREVLVLREIEDLSYREIADVTAVPIGTVMSRLARARRLLQDGWYRLEQEEDAHGLRR
jgi:RNA polymerase sigma-70 factor (ECF subfamily)